MLTAMVVAPPPKKKTNPLLIVAAILGGLGLLFALGVAGVAFWWHRNKTRLFEESKQAGSEGVQFATGRAQVDCVDEGLRRGKSCGAAGFLCEATNQIFMESCLEHAAPTPGFCDGVPPRDEIMSTSAWLLRECERRGDRSQRCTRMLQRVPDACHPDGR